MPAELQAALIAYGLPGLLLVGAGWVFVKFIEVVHKAIEKRYEFRIGPKQ